MLLFGGSGAHGAVDDTWIWEGANWTEQHPSVRPAARSDPVLAFDNATGRMLLFGGVDSRGTLLNDTWAWNGATWEEQSVAAAPPARKAASM
ncbi:MAG: hypothetical protein E6I75_10895, partial [Chloroflexi bacterium]